MAEEDLSELYFPWQLGLNLVNYGLGATLVGDALISMTKANRVHTIVCDLSEMDKKIDREGVVSHDFGLVTFTYFCGLGKLHLLEEHPYYTPDDVEKWEKFLSELQQYCDLRHSNSDTEMSQSLIESVEFVEDAPKLLEWARIAPGRNCHICDSLLRNGEEVATLVNLKLKELACFSTSFLGMYHIYHTPCLISWMLFCDFMNENGTRAAREIGVQLHSVMCPECEGTGLFVGEKKEDPPFDGPRMDMLRRKAFDSHMKWMNSTSEASRKGGKVVGVDFSAPPTNSAPKVEIMKTLKIYRAV